MSTTQYNHQDVRIANAKQSQATCFRSNEGSQRDDHRGYLEKLENQFKRGEITIALLTDNERAILLINISV